MARLAAVRLSCIIIDSGQSKTPPVSTSDSTAREILENVRGLDRVKLRNVKGVEDWFAVQ